MKKNITNILIFVIICTVISTFANFPSVNAQETDFDVEIVVFYGQGCPHCASEEKFLEQVIKKYPNIHVERYEIYFNKTNRELMQKMADAYKIPLGGVPTTYINQKVITGFSDNIGRTIENEIMHCLEFGGCDSPLKKLNVKPNNEEVSILIKTDVSPIEHPDKTQNKNTLTLGAVISGALIDSINPCEFAVLIILLTTIISAGGKRKALFAGLAFTLSIFISYYLMGLGLFSAISFSGFTHTFFTIVAIFAIIIGLFNLKDYFWYGKYFLMEVPLSWRPKMKMLLKSVTSVPGAFLIGFVVSLFLLPCTSGPYIVILGLLAQTTTKNHAMLLLLLYNFIFVMPMLIISLMVYFGFTTTEKAEQWRTRKLKILHLIAGVVMILMGIAMFIALGLGYV